MIAFLLVTSIVNLALGYALAVYLGHASTAATADESTTTMINTIITGEAYGRPSASSSWSPDGLRAPTSAVAAMPTLAQTPDAAQATIVAENSLAVSEFQERATELENELLAGIEDFRHQLAQLKGQGVAKGLLDPLAVGAAS